MRTIIAQVFLTKYELILDFFLQCLPFHVCSINDFVLNKLKFCIHLWIQVSQLHDNTEKKFHLGMKGGKLYRLVIKKHVFIWTICNSLLRKLFKNRWLSWPYISLLIKIWWFGDIFSVSFIQSSITRFIVSLLVS